MIATQLCEKMGELQAFYSFTDYTEIDIIGKVATRNSWIKSTSDFEPRYRQAYRVG